MENNNNNEQKLTVGYVLGTIFGTVCITCATFAVIALTVRFLMWLF